MRTTTNLITCVKKPAKNASEKKLQSCIKEGLMDNLFNMAAVAGVLRKYLASSKAELIITVEEKHIQLCMNLIDFFIDTLELQEDDEIYNYSPMNPKNAPFNVYLQEREDIYRDEKSSAVLIELQLLIEGEQKSIEQITKH